MNTSPTLPRNTGPGVGPLNVHSSWLTPGATSACVSWACSVAWCSVPPGAGARSGSNGFQSGPGFAFGSIVASLFARVLVRRRGGCHLGARARHVDRQHHAGFFVPRDGAPRLHGLGHRSDVHLRRRAGLELGDLGVAALDGEVVDHRPVVHDSQGEVGATRNLDRRRGYGELREHHFDGLGLTCGGHRARVVALAEANHECDDECKDAEDPNRHNPEGERHRCTRFGVLALEFGLVHGAATST